LPEDFGHLLVEKDPAVGLVAKQPEPWPQREPVSAEFESTADTLRLGQDAIEHPLLAFVDLELDGAGLSQDLVEIDALDFAQRLDLEFEQFAESFRAREIAQDEHILPERRPEFGHAARLADLGHFTIPPGGGNRPMR